jgi:hypothetical protein
VEVKNARARWVRAEIERLKTMKEGEE